MNAIALGSAVLITLPAGLRGDNIKNGQGDTGYIKGKTTEKGVPVSRRVMCYHRLTGELVASTWSELDGSYQLNGLVSNVAYFVTSIDENNDSVQYNAVTQDLIVASEVVS